MKKFDFQKVSKNPTGKLTKEEYLFLVKEMEIKYIIDSHTVENEDELYIQGQNSTYSSGFTDYKDHRKNTKKQLLEYAKKIIYGDTSRGIQYCNFFKKEQQFSGTKESFLSRMRLDIPKSFTVIGFHGGVRIILNW